MFAIASCLFNIKILNKIQIIMTSMQNQKRKGNSFFDQTLQFKGNFHTNQKLLPMPKKEDRRIQMFARFQRAIERKIVHAKRRLLGQNQKTIAIITQKHEYEYKQFGNEPKIDFSDISLLLMSPILLRINLSIAQNQGINILQFLFVTFFVAFVFNLLFIVRKNRLMPYLPDRSKDNKLKIASGIALVAIYCSFNYGWSASGGMVFAIIWESLAGKQGFLYLFIFGGIVGGSIIMQLNSPRDLFLKLLSSILFGISESLIHNLKENSPYAIANQVSLFIMLGMSVSFPFMTVISLSMWQYLVLIILGFSMYFNLLLMIKLMQTQRVSIVMGVTSGIIIISSTQFLTVSDYVACLTIVLSILVLLKVEYLDKGQI